MMIVYFNGEFIPESQAKISIFDRGFLFGDSVYEVIPVYQQHFVGLIEHLERLMESLKAIQMPAPLSIHQWQQICQKLISLNDPHKDQCIYLQITRGVEKNRSFAIPEGIQPTILAMCYPTQKKSVESIHKGFRVITLQDKRRFDCHIKATTLLPNVLAYQNALDNHCEEAILIRDGYALEATSSNLFIVKNGILITPPLQPNILAGVTRQTILKLAHANQIPTQENQIRDEELFEADEVWITASNKEIYPIIAINDRIIGNGQPGPLWKTMWNLYQQYKASGQYNYNERQYDGSQL